MIHQILLPWQPAFLQFEKYWGLIWWVTCWHRHECFTRCRRSKSKASSRWNCIFQEFSLIWGLLHFYSYLMLWNLVCNGNKLPPFRFIFQIVHLHSLYSSINSLFHTCICICIYVCSCININHIFVAIAILLLLLFLHALFESGRSSNSGLIWHDPRPGLPDRPNKWVIIIIVIAIGVIIVTINIIAIITILKMGVKKTDLPNEMGPVLIATMMITTMLTIPRPIWKGVRRLLAREAGSSPSRRHWLGFGGGDTGTAAMPAHHHPCQRQVKMATKVKLVFVDALRSFR